jgi:hypothetical protein
MVVAWQGDVLEGDGRLVADLPVATDNGRPLTARVRAEFICDGPGVVCLPLSGKNGTRSLPTASRDTAQAEFRRRRYPGSAPEPIAADRWRFARMEGGGPGRAGGRDRRGTGDRSLQRHILFPEGFEPGWIYELVYSARDPLVLDMGFVAMRELVAALRAGKGEALGLGGAAAPTRFHAWGRSQSGRAIRDFIHRGFNADAAGRKVFDGVVSHIAGGGRTAMNRFSNLVVAALAAIRGLVEPGRPLPLFLRDEHRPQHGRARRHPQAARHRPTGHPYPVGERILAPARVAGAHGQRGNDLPQPDTVRIYFWSSSQHWSDPSPFRPEKGICQNYQNVVATSPLFRSTLALLDAWVKDGIPPPESRIPRHADGTLLTMAQWRATVPGDPRHRAAGLAQRTALHRLRHRLRVGRAGGRTAAMDLDKGYAVLVPAVDATGNDAAGIRNADGRGAARHLHRLEPAHRRLRPWRACTTSAAATSRCPKARTSAA